MMKRGLILIFVLGFLFVNLQDVSASISCGSQTYPDGTGYCCDTNNGANGVWFRGDYYDSCPAGTFRYVNNQNPSCSNLGQGTYSQPWCNMSKANTAPSGNIVIVLGGVYNEVPSKNCAYEGGGATLHPDNSGTPGNPTIFRGHPDYPRPIIMGRHTGPTFARLMGYDNDYWHKTVCLPSYTTIEYMDVVNGSCMGILANAAKSITIQDNLIHEHLGTGGANCAHIGFFYDGETQDIIIRGNEIYGPVYEMDAPEVCTAENCGGITIYRSHNITIENNYFHDLGPTAIFFKQMVSRSVIRNNVFTRNGRDINIDCPLLYSDWGDYGPPPRYTGDIDVYGNIVYNSTGNFPPPFGWGYYGPDVHLMDRDRCTSPIRNVRIFNNILFDNPTETGIGLYQEFDYENHNTSIFNNIVYDYGLSANRENLYMDIPSLIIDMKSGNNIYYDSFETTMVDYGRALYDLFTFQTSIRPDLEINSIQSNPLFLSTTFGDPNFLRPSPTSPAIDNGTIVPGYHCNVSASTDPTQTGCKLWYGSAPDIGAYEYNPGIPIVTCVQADVNDDLIVNIIDLALVIYNQGQPLTGRAHLNVNSQDSVINYQDVSEVRNRLGQRC